MQNTTNEHADGNKKHVKETTVPIEKTNSIGTRGDSLPIEGNNGVTMEPLQLPWNSKYWNLFIVNPKSTVELWGRLIGPEYSVSAVFVHLHLHLMMTLLTQDKLDNLTIDIEMDLMKERRKPTELIKGEIYLIIISECTNRVRVDHIDAAANRCLCFYIDTGDEEWMATDDLYECKAKFRRLPAQAVCLSLFCLEDFAENPSAKPHLDTMLSNKVVICEILSKKEEYEEQEASEYVAPKVRVAMYDTSSDEDVHLNNVILEMICSSYEAPTLQPIGITNVLISHVADDGAVYCQLRQPTGGLQYVQKLIHHLTQFEFNRKQHQLRDEDVAADASTTSQKKIYLVQDSVTSKWYRAYMVKCGNATHNLMFYVDYGMTRMVEKKNILRLDSLSSALNNYPYQAILCRLHEIDDMTASIVDSLRGYLNANKPAVVSGKLLLLLLFLISLYANFLLDKSDDNSQYGTDR